MSAKTKIVVIGTGVVLLSMIFLAWARSFLEVDKCLDRGGRWNYETKECEL